MKKSELYKEIQLAVLRDDGIEDEIRLEMIRELQDKEELELYKENQAKLGEEREEKEI